MFLNFQFLKMAGGGTELKALQKQVTEMAQKNCTNTSYMRLSRQTKLREMSVTMLTPVTNEQLLLAKDFEM
jgi:hypothetical protein